MVRTSSRNRLYSESLSTDRHQGPIKGILKNALIPTKRSVSECVDDLSQFIDDLNLNIDDLKSRRFCPLHPFIREDSESSDEEQEEDEDGQHEHHDFKPSATQNKENESDKSNKVIDKLQQQQQLNHHNHQHNQNGDQIESIEQAKDEHNGQQPKANSVIEKREQLGATQKKLKTTTISNIDTSMNHDIKVDPIKTNNNNNNNYLASAAKDEVDPKQVKQQQQQKQAEQSEKRCSCHDRYRSDSTDGSILDGNDVIGRKQKKSVRFDEQVYESVYVAARLYDRKSMAKFHFSTRHHPPMNGNHKHQKKMPKSGSKKQNHNKNNGKQQNQQQHQNHKQQSSKRKRNDQKDEVISVR